jgi:hypothetical protein
MAGFPCLNMFMNVVTLMLVCFTYSRCKTKFIGDSCVGARCRPACSYSLLPEVGRRLAAGLIPFHSHTCARCSLTVTFLIAVAVNADRSLLLSRWVASGYLLRLRIRDDVSLPPDVSALPDILPGVTSLVLFWFCCRSLLRVCQVLMCPNFGFSLVFQ